MSKGDLKQSVVMDLEGNLPRQAKVYEKALGGMAKRGEKHLSGMARMSQIAGRGLDKLGNRYTGLISGATVALAVKQVGDLSERYTRLGIAADLSDEQVQRLKGSVFEVSQAPDIRVDPSEMISAIEDIVEKTGDLDFAQNNIRNIGLAIQATGAAGADVGALLAEFQKQGITAPEKVLQTIDALNEQGKEGAFTLKDLASLGPRVVAAYNATGRSGVQSMKEMGAALQVIRMGTGSSEQAATAFEATLRTMADPKKIAKLKELGGIEIFDPAKLKEGKQQLRPINELMVDIIKAASGKQTNLAQVFDAEAMRAFNSAAAEYQRTGAVASLDKMMQVQGDGATTLRDSSRAAREFNASLTYLKTSWDQFADSNLSEPIKDLADVLNSLDPDQVQSYFELAKKGVIGLGGAIVASKVIGGAFALRRGLVEMRTGGIAGGKAGAAGKLLGAVGGKPIPVYVVNNMGDMGIGGKGGKGIRTPSRWQMLKASPNLKSIGALGAGAIGTAGLAVGAAGAAGYGAGSLAYKGIEGTEFADAIGSGVAHFLALFGNEEAKASIAANEQQQKQEAVVRLQIDSAAPVRIKDMNADGIDIDVDAGQTMGAY